MGLFMFVIRKAAVVGGQYGGQSKQMKIGHVIPIDYVI